MNSLWRRVAAVGVALAPFLVLAAAEWPLQPDLWYSDFAQYVAHAAALADGRPYTDTGYIFVQKAVSWAPRAYPPGLPLALTPVVWLFGGQVWAVKAWMILLSAASIVLAGAWFWRRVGPLAGLGVIALVGLSPQWLSLSVAPLSDVVFVGAVWAVLLAADHRAEWSWRRVALVTLLAGGALAVRPHGLILIPTLFVWGLVQQRHTTLRVFVPPFALAGAIAVARLVLPAASVRTPSPDRMLGELLTFDIRYHLAIFDSHLYPFPWNVANDGYHAVTGILMVVGLVVLVRRVGLALPIVFAALYALALGSFSITDARLAFPLYPLLVFGSLNGVCWLIGRWHRRLAGRLTLGFAAVLAFVVVARGVTAPREPRVLDDPDYRGIVSWVETARDASPEPLRVAFFRPRVLAWETGVRAMPLLSWPRVPEHMDEWCANGIDYVIVGSVGEGMSGRRMEWTTEAIALAPDAFETVYGNPAFQVYRLRRDLACGDGDSGSPEDRARPPETEASRSEAERAPGPAGSGEGSRPDSSDSRPR